jgi:hypothetical protein
MSIASEVLGDEIKTMASSKGPVAALSRIEDLRSMRDARARVYLDALAQRGSQRATAHPR